MRLQSGPLTALVTSQGGSILQLQSNEHYLLGPARHVQVAPDKMAWRGESHWCFPNYGRPSPRYVPDQPKHGHLRQTMLSCGHNDGRKVVFGSTDAESTRRFLGGLGVNIQVELGVGIITTQLGAVNLGDKPQPILPAFHPYFAVPKAGLTVNCDGKTKVHVEGDTVEGLSSNARFVGFCGNSIHFHGVGSIDLRASDNCIYMAIWSDQPQSYICVEPVFYRSWDDFRSGWDGQWLEPGEELTCEVEMKFTPE